MTKKYVDVPFDVFMELLRRFKSSADVYEERKAEIVDTITNYVLNMLKIPSKNKGYEYLKTAIKHEIVEDDKFHICCSMYESIALKHSTTPSMVKKSIEHAVKGVVESKNQFKNEVFQNSIVHELDFVKQIAEFIQKNFL